jgi:hypothetical protein
VYISRLSTSAALLYVVLLLYEVSGGLDHPTRTIALTYEGSENEKYRGDSLAEVCMLFVHTLKYTLGCIALVDI